MESMKDAKNRPPEQIKGDPMGDGIAVFELRFCVPNGRDLPYVDAHGGRGTLRSERGRKITYFPRIRHHQVTVNFPDARVKKFYIHESWATWEALE